MFFEEFAVGQQYTLPPVNLTREEILAFAQAYDPQPIHIDAAFAEAGPFGGIIASGFHTACLVWREWIRLNRFGTEIIAGTGMDYLTWNAPVRPGDTLQAIVEITATQRSQNPGRGRVTFKFAVTNQLDQLVLTFQGSAYVKTQATEPL